MRLLSVLRSVLFLLIDSWGNIIVSRLLGLSQSCVCFKSTIILLVLPRSAHKSLSLGGVLNMPCQVSISLILPWVFIIMHTVQLSHSSLALIDFCSFSSRAFWVEEATEKFPLPGCEPRIVGNSGVLIDRLHHYSKPSRWYNSASVGSSRRSTQYPAHAVRCFSLLLTQAYLAFNHNTICLSAVCNLNLKLYHFPVLYPSNFRVNFQG